MNYKSIKNTDLIDLILSSAANLRSTNYKSRESVEKYIGLTVARTGFYGKQITTDMVDPLPLSTTDFVSATDINLVIEGIVVLDKTPAITGGGAIVYNGYGVLEVDGSVVYDGRSGSAPVIPLTGRKTLVKKYGGDDATAVPGNEKLPYATFSAAILGSADYDIIEVHYGVYDELAIIPPAGRILTINLLAGAYIAPTANGGKTSIFREETTPGWAGVNFTIVGAGKDVCGFRCKGSSYADTSAIVVSRANTRYNVSNMQCSSWEADYGYSDANRNSSYFKDVLIDYEIDIYSTNRAVFEDCTFLNCNMFRRNLADQKQNISFINCKFIRTVATIAYDTDYSTTGTDANGLDTWHSKNYDSSGTPSNILFKGCQFYNLVGGNGITIFGKAGGANKSITLDSCAFYCNDLAKAAIVVDGVDSAVSHKWMIQNCVSNVAPTTINGGTLTNLLSGTGFQVNANFTIPNIIY